MMMTASVIFYYCVLPKDKSVEPDKDIIITSENPCELLFLQKILKFDADIIVGHRDWEMNADEILDINTICRDMEYSSDSKLVFNDIMAKFKIRLGLFWDMDMGIKLYRKYFQNYYAEYFSKLSKSKQADPPKAIFYNAFANTVNEFINIEKKHGNIILKPGR